MIYKKTNQNTLFTVTSDSLTRYRLHRIFRFVKESGFEAIEIAITKNYDTQDGSYLNELVKEYNLPIVAISAELLDFKLTSFIKKEIPEMRKKEEMHICLENSDASTFLGILPRYAMNSLNDLKSFKSMCLDTSNLASKKIDLMRIYNELKGFIKHIHISNTKGSKGHLLPEHGILPLESFLTSLKKDDYKGNISLRVRPKELKEGDTKKVVERLKEAKAYMEKYFKG